MGFFLVFLSEVLGDAQNRRSPAFSFETYSCRDFVALCADVADVIQAL